MKALFVTLGTPWPPERGARLRDYHLIRRAAKFAEVALVTLVPAESEAEAVGEMRKWCTHVEAVVLPRDRWCRLASPALGTWPIAALPFYSPMALTRLRCAVESLRPDIVQIEHSFLAPYVTAVRGAGRARTILSLHNVGFRQYETMARGAGSPIRRAGFGLKAALLRRCERSYVPLFDAAVVVSALEREALQRLLPGVAIEVVPNGVDTAACRMLDDEPGGGLLFVGNLAYQPNVDAVLYFCREVLPILRPTFCDLRLTIVGPQPPTAVSSLAHLRDVEVTGVVEDLAPYYQRARICVVPLLAGGGTRLKILEAMAYGRPVVSTRVGCEGLAVEEGRHLLVGDTPSEMAAEITRLLRDLDLYGAIRESARRLVEEQYDWDYAATRLQALHTRLANRGFPIDNPPSAVDFPRGA